jgi:hypothetical protein
MTDLVAGHVKMGSVTWSSAISQIRAGTVMPLAVSSARPMPEFPDVPTMKALGYPDLVAKGSRRKKCRPTNSPALSPAKSRGGRRWRSR